VLSFFLIYIVVVVVFFSDMAEHPKVKHARGGHPSPSAWRLRKKGAYSGTLIFSSFFSFFRLWRGIIIVLTLSSRRLCLWRRAE
jgi:hypothetical protein